MTYLCYWGLHVDGQTFPVHALVEADSQDEALSKLESRSGPHYCLQAKGCVGEFDLEEARELMAPREIVVDELPPPPRHPTAGDKVEGPCRILRC